MRADHSLMSWSVTASFFSTMVLTAIVIVTRSYRTQWGKRKMDLKMFPSLSSKVKFFWIQFDLNWMHRSFILSPFLTFFIHFTSECVCVRFLPKSVITPPVFPSTSVVRLPYRDAVLSASFPTFDDLPHEFIRPVSVTSLEAIISSSVLSLFRFCFLARSLSHFCVRITLRTVGAEWAHQLRVSDDSSEQQ